MAGRSYKTEAVVLRSLRFGEADRVLHLYTLERGRVGAVAKGIRRTKSRFGARLEPLSHVELVLHEGAGELHTVTGVASTSCALTVQHERIPTASASASSGSRRCCGSSPSRRQILAFHALTRFLDLLDGAEPRTGERAATDPLVLSF